MGAPVLQPSFTQYPVQRSWTFPALLCFIGLLFLIGGISLFFVPVANSAHTILLSPLAQATPHVPSSNPQLDIIHRKKTTDQYPPHEAFPLTIHPTSARNPDISAAAYALMDLDTRELLLAKNLTEERSIASITKVMTALIALESAPLDLTLSVSSSAGAIGEATMGISGGERYQLKDLLYGAMLPSGNDAAETIAEGVGKYLKQIPQSDVDGGGARLGFLQKMNDKAQQLGMMDTFFFNPSGLDEETAASSNFSTPLDLLALGTYALTNPTLAEIVNTRYHEVAYEEGAHKELYLYNILQLSDSYPGIAGIKPGNSIFAGETLLSYLHRGNRRLLAVVLDSQHTKDDVLTLYKTVIHDP